MAGTAVMDKGSKKPRQKREVVKTFRVTPDWSQAFDRLVEHCNLQSPIEVTPSDVFGIAVADYAAKVGFPEPFPKR